MHCSTLVHSPGKDEWWATVNIKPSSTYSYKGSFVIVESNSRAPPRLLQWQVLNSAPLEEQKGGIETQCRLMEKYPFFRISLQGWPMLNPCLECHPYERLYNRKTYRGYKVVPNMTAYELADFCSDPVTNDQLLEASPVFFYYCKDTTKMGSLYWISCKSLDLHSIALDQIERIYVGKDSPLWAASTTELARQKFDMECLTIRTRKQQITFSCGSFLQRRTWLQHLDTIMGSYRPCTKIQTCQEDKKHPLAKSLSEASTVHSSTTTN